MAERLRVTANGRTGYVYPVGADAVKVAKAGGMSKLSPEEQKEMAPRLKRAVPGDFCDDLPASTIPIYLERGWIERVPDLAANLADLKRVMADGAQTIASTTAAMQKLGESLGEAQE